MTAWILASLVTLEKIWLMVTMAPDIFRTFISRMAPKIIQMVSKAPRNPPMVLAAISLTPIPQTAAAMTAARIHARGRALLAGQPKKTIRITVVRIGIDAIRAYINVSSSSFFSYTITY